MYISFNANKMWNNIGINEYNAVAAANGWPLWQAPLDLIAGDINLSKTKFPCTVKAMIGETYGKMN